MSRARSAQVHVIVIRRPDGATWVVGTPSQKGFTELGAHKALSTQLNIPTHWEADVHEITPIDEVVALKR